MTEFPGLKPRAESCSPFRTESHRLDRCPCFGALAFFLVHTAPSLGVPWYAILGNHDYKGLPQAQLDYAKTHPNWKMPARYFSVVEPIADNQKAEFFFIDTSPFVDEYRKKPDMRDEIISQDASAQVRWLDHALSDSTAAWKIVIGHHPIFSGGRDVVSDTGAKPGGCFGGVIDDWSCVPCRSNARWAQDRRGAALEMCRL